MYIGSLLLENAPGPIGLYVLDLTWVLRVLGYSAFSLEYTGCVVAYSFVQKISAGLLRIGNYYIGPYGCLQPLPE